VIVSAWRRFLGSYLFFSFRRDRIAILSFVVLCTFFQASFSAPLLAPFDPYDPIQIDIMDSEIPPVWMEEGDQRFLLGTDVQGRDLLSTILYGSRISITIGIFAVLLQAFLGISIGLVSGYFGGRLDNFLMRLADIQLSFSTLMVAIISLAVFQALFGTELYEKLAIVMLILVIGIAEWPHYALLCHFLFPPHIRLSNMGAKSQYV
jgi:peptide/nickel transport system permease protein